RLLIYEVGKSFSDIVNKRWQAHGAASHVESCFGHRSTADHIHVHHGFDPLRKFRTGIQQRQSAFNFRRPDETNGSKWRRKLAFINQLRERSGHLQDGGTSTGIVVGAGALVVQMTTERDLLVFEFGVGAGNYAGDNLIVAWMLAGAHRGV